MLVSAGSFSGLREGQLLGHRIDKQWRLGESGTGIIFVIEPKDGLPEGETPLSVPIDGLPQPEIMTAREMLAVGNPYLRLPELVR